MIKYLIVPDVHGRDFWKVPLYDTLKNTNDDVVFLGDYLDCYPDEFDSNFELDCNASTGYLQTAIDNFKQIIELKKQYSDRITLLLGNHKVNFCF